MSISTIFEAGMDALENEFQLIIPTFPGVTDLQNTNIRITDVEIPGLDITVDKQEYKAQAMTKPAGKIDVKNSFSFTFRTDKLWKVYEGFENWMSLIINPDTGVMGNDGLPGVGSLIRVPMSVIPIDFANNINYKGWDFTGCWPSSLDGVSFKHSGGTPLTAKCTMQFIKKVKRT